MLFGGLWYTWDAIICGFRGTNNHYISGTKPCVRCCFAGNAILKDQNYHCLLIHMLALPHRLHADI